VPAWLNIPNSITLARLLMTPFVIRAILLRNAWEALGLFFVAAVTDVLDGTAARRLGTSTQTGAYLDPIADKCLMSGVFVALAAARQIPWWIVALVLGRDVYILAGVGLIAAFSRIRKFPPSVWGKISTFVQIATVVTRMTQNALQSPALEWISGAMLWVCAAFTVWSGLHYTWRAIQITKGN
jgi:cardiolipin synthase (CMP-forming)